MINLYSNNTQILPCYFLGVKLKQYSCPIEGHILLIKDVGYFRVQGISQSGSMNTISLFHFIHSIKKCVNVGTGRAENDVSILIHDGNCGAKFQLCDSSHHHHPWILRHLSVHVCDPHPHSISLAHFLITNVWVLTARTETRQNFKLVPWRCFCLIAWLFNIVKKDIRCFSLRHTKWIYIHLAYLIHWNVIQ